MPFPLLLSVIYSCSRVCVWVCFSCCNILIALVIFLSNVHFSFIVFTVAVLYIFSNWFWEDYCKCLFHFSSMWLHTHREEYIFCIPTLCSIKVYRFFFGFLKVSHISYKNTALFLFQSMVVWTRMVPKCWRICMLSPQLLDCLKRTKRHVLVGVGVLLGMCSEGPKAQALLFIQSAPPSLLPVDQDVKM